MNTSDWGWDAGTLKEDKDEVPLLTNVKSVNLAIWEVNLFESITS